MGRYSVGSAGPPVAPADEALAARSPPWTSSGLILENVSARKLRASLTAVAVAIAVMAVMTLGILTSSLKTTATEILKVGNADFSVAEKNQDILSSTITTQDLAAMSKVPGVGSMVGALIQTDHYDAGHPGVIEVGLDPSAQKQFGVVVLEGQSYTPTSPDQIMLGYVLAQSIHKKVGDTLKIGGPAGHPTTRHVVGIYRTNVAFGNSTMMFPLTTLQSENQLTGQVTLGFVKVAPGADRTRWPRRSTGASCSTPPSSRPATTAGPTAPWCSSVWPTRAGRSWLRSSPSPGCSTPPCSRSSSAPASSASCARWAGLGFGSGPGAGRGGGMGFAGLVLGLVLGWAMVNFLST